MSLWIHLHGGPLCSPTNFILQTAVKVHAQLWFFSENNYLVWACRSCDWDMIAKSTVAVRGNLCWPVHDDDSEIILEDQIVLNSCTKLNYQDTNHKTAITLNTKSIKAACLLYRRITDWGDIKLTWSFFSSCFFLFPYFPSSQPASHFLNDAKLMVISMWRLRFTCSFHCGLFLFDQCNYLQSAKMFNYGTGWRKTCDTLFVVFAVAFLVTRLVIFPSK